MLKKMKELGLALACALAAIAAGTTAAQADAMEDIVTRGQIIVGVQSQGTPINFIDRNGDRVGLAVSIIDMMAEDMGVTVEYVDFDWAGLIPALLSGKIDLIAADMTPTAERSMSLIFSDPVFYTENVAFTLEDSPYQTWQELNVDGIAVGATQASTYGRVAKMFLPNAELKEYAGGTTDTIQALLSGRVDAGVSDVGTLRSLSVDFPQIRILDGVMSQEPLAFPVRPDSVHLAFFLNNYIKLISHDGRLDATLDYWWNSLDWVADHK